MFFCVARAFLLLHCQSVILLHPPVPVLGVSTTINRGAPSKPARNALLGTDELRLYPNYGSRPKPPGKHEDEVLWHQVHLTAAVAFSIGIAAVRQ